MPVKLNTYLPAARGLPTVMLAVAFFVGSAVEVAVIVTVLPAGDAAGAV